MTKKIRYTATFRQTYPDCQDRMLKGDNDGIDDTMIGMGSNRVCTWTCPSGHKYRQSPHGVGRGQTCVLCKKTFRTSVLDRAPWLEAEFVPEDNGGITAADVGSGESQKYIWTCSLGHKWAAPAKARVKGRGCPYCTNQKILPGYNDAATKHPHLLAQWDAEKNDVDIHLISTGYRDKCWWQCPHGHSYQNTIAAQLQVRACPVCSSYQIQKGINDLASMYPLLAAEWDYDRNSIGADQVSSGSGKKVWWVCNKGHHYECTVSNRTCIGQGCPYCSGKKVLDGFNDLASQAPYLLAEWDYDSNPAPQIVYWRSQKRYWWRCRHCGARCKRSVVAKLQGLRCPYCQK